MSATNARVLSRAAYDRALRTHAQEVAARLADLNRRLDGGAGGQAAWLELERDVAASGLFDEEFYLRWYPDVKAAGVDALNHYVTTGEAEGRLPNSIFSAAQYRTLNTIPADVHAFGHYVRSGEGQGLLPSAWFDAKEYLQANPDLPTDVRPAFHFIKLGRKARLPIRRLGVKPARSRKPEPRIAAFVGVKDEVELIRPAIEHLRRIGVDHIVVCDHLSTDGTADVLDECRGKDFVVVTPDQLATTKDAWSNDGPLRFIGPAFDWVALLDADDFLIPASGNLKDCLALHAADALLVDRFNVVVSQDGLCLPRPVVPERFDELLLFADRIPDSWDYQRRNPDAPLIRSHTEHKLLVRRDKMSALAPGHHDVSDNAFYRMWPTDLLVAHVAFSTQARFVRKVENIATHFADYGIDVLEGRETWQNNPVAWHWRRWVELARQGRLQEEFERNVFHPDRVAELRRDGVIRSAGDLLRRGEIAIFSRGP